MDEIIAQKKIGLIGVGNLLLSDEGFGIHLIRHIADNFSTPSNVEIVDAGTAGIYLAPIFETTDPILIIDTVMLDEEPGTIRCFGIEDLNSKAISSRMSPHQVGFLEILDICRLRGKAPEQVELIGVVPEDLSPGTELSPTLERQLDKVTGLVSEWLLRLGVSLTPL